MDLSSLPDDGLSRLVANCVFQAVGHGPKRGLALAKLHNAYPEIERRSAKLDDKGLLALMGYRVGYREGVAEERRRAVKAGLRPGLMPEFRIQAQAFTEWIVQGWGAKHVAVGEVPPPAAGTWTVTIATTCGDVVVEMDADAAPQGVGNFLGLAEAGFFDATPCHRLTTSGIGPSKPRRADAAIVLQEVPQPGKASSRPRTKTGLRWRSMPSVVGARSSMWLPHIEPAPCAGKTSAWSPSGSSFWWMES